MKRLIIVIFMLLCLVLTGCSETELLGEAAQFVAASLETEAPATTPSPTPTCTPMPLPTTPSPAEYCTHPQTGWQWSGGRCVPIDTEKHLLMRNENLLCGLCRTVLRTATLRMEEPHSFSQQGECYMCGYHKPMYTGTPERTQPPERNGRPAITDVPSPTPEPQR